MTDLYREGGVHLHSDLPRLDRFLRIGVLYLVVNRGLEITARCGLGRGADLVPDTLSVRWQVVSA